MAWKPLAECATLPHEQMDTGRESSRMQTAQHQIPFRALPLLGKWLRQSVAPGLPGVYRRLLSSVMNVASVIIIKLGSRLLPLAT